jgi:hypothetical protein
MMTGANADHAMIFFGIVLGLGIMIAMIFMALNKKSTFTVRIASLGALALMIITTIICIIILSHAGEVVPVDESVVYIGPPVTPVKKESGDGAIILVCIIFMVVLFITIFVLAMREHRKHSPKAAAQDKKFSDFS